ncbi:MAG TPA: septum formation initiator family protein [Anaerolineae bacterium]|nr:septum formation initiator family protein [Anaerolineae bacterium]
MTEGKIRTTLPLRLILVIVMGAVILYMGAGFVRQVSVSYQRRQELRKLEQEIAVAQQDRVRLEEHLEYVRSPEAAEKWGRENGWAKEDEVSVVVVAPSAELSASGGREPIQDTKPGSNREAWWDLFFGER